MFSASLSRAFLHSPLSSKKKKKPILPSTRRPLPAVAAFKIEMDDIAELARNKVLVACTLSWAIGQLSKSFTSPVRGNGFDWKAAVRSGGMPSTHSASVAAAATSVGLERGFSDPIFGMSVIFAALVMYDAQGRRRVINMHVKVLCSLTDATQASHLPATLESHQGPTWSQHQATFIRAGARTPQPTLRYGIITMRQAMKCAIFENRSTTTKMESCFHIQPTSHAGVPACVASPGKGIVSYELIEVAMGIGWGVFWSLGSYGVVGKRVADQDLSEVVAGCGRQRWSLEVMVAFARKIGIEGIEVEDVVVECWGGDSRLVVVRREGGGRLWRVREMMGGRLDEEGRECVTSKLCTSILTSTSASSALFRSPSDVADLMDPTTRSSGDPAPDSSSESFSHHVEAQEQLVASMHASLLSL
ncbi:hypothetical protein KSP39_PZI013624 [Platanthera zijinensis]|uniref:Acid phosphatase/vanadium-dependent haloperoxidase-related protein n=1 Tax=Platanthera zijinensis TaxID=2320716 RepID=A0AAP0BCW3_9ASPA